MLFKFLMDFHRLNWILSLPMNDSIAKRRMHLLWCDSVIEYIVCYLYMLLYSCGTLAHIYTNTEFPLQWLLLSNQIQKNICIPFYLFISVHAQTFLSLTFFYSLHPCSFCSCSYFKDVRKYRIVCNFWFCCVVNGFFPLNFHSGLLLRGKTGASFQFHIVCFFFCIR